MKRVMVSLAPALLVAASVVATAHDASATLTPRVLGGRPAPPTEARADATVAIRSQTGALVCSGVLVAPRLVLTAAHCLPLPSGDDSPPPRDVCFGPRANACTTTRAVTAHHLHPEWDPFTFRADLAVLVLSENAPAAAIRLPTANAQRVARDAELEVIGYGRTAASEFESSGEKRAGLTRVTEIDDEGRIVHGEIACNGDSGGPLFATRSPDPDVLVAITSSGPVGCRTFGRATPVLAHRAWIEAEITASEESDTASEGCSIGMRSERGTCFSSPLVALAALSALAWARSGSRRVARHRPPRRDASSRS